MPPKKPPMRTSEDVIHRIQHDESINRERITVGYLDRFLGVIEKKFNDFVWCKVEMASIYDLAIPKHRIEYFKYHNEIIWSKKDRVDKVFGSSNSSDQSILEVIASIEANLILEEHNSAHDHSELEPKSKGYVNSRYNKTSGQGLRPTHFICLPFQDTRIRKNISTVQNTICSQTQLHGNDVDRVKDEACIPLTALHMTLVMMRLPTQESVEIACREFSKMRDLLQLYLPRHLLLTLEGVRDFSSRVVYTEPVEAGRLSSLVADIKDRLTRAGIHLVGNHEPFHAHVTIAKLNRSLSRDWNGTLQLDHSVYGRHQHMWIGTQACHSLEMCELYSEKHPVTGFYKCLDSLSNTEHCVPLQGIVQSNIRARRKIVSPDCPREVIEQCLGVSLGTLQTQKSEHACFILVMRGLPGSGKSTLASKLAAEWNRTLHDTSCKDETKDCATGYDQVDCALIVSADDYMFSDGKKFDAGALAGAHARCLQQARDFVKLYAEAEDILPYPGLLIVDNTNTLLSEYAEYRKMGRLRGVMFGVIEVESSLCSTDRTLETLPSDEICHLSLENSVLVARRGVHGVPEDTVKNMWKRWIPDPISVVARKPTSKQVFSQWMSAINYLSGCIDDEIQCQYVGVVLEESSRQRLLAAYPAKHPSRIRAHHCTLVHASSMDAESDYSAGMIRLGTVCEVRVYGEIADNVCHGVVVEVTPLGTSKQMSNLSGHITLSHDPTVTAKHTAEILASGYVGDSTYSLRQESDVLVLRGIISACVTRNTSNSFGRKSARGPDYISHPADIIASFQHSKQDSVPKNAPICLCKEPTVRFTRDNSFSFNFISASTRRLCVFDMDDTLVATPSKEAYEALTGHKWRRSPKGRGWFASPDSLSLSLPIGPANGLSDFFDQVGQECTQVIVLTGRFHDLKPQIEKLLASRNLLEHVDAVICKPLSAPRNTAEFKAEYIKCLLLACPHLQTIECWDDKLENLDAIATTHNALVATGESTSSLQVHLVEPEISSTSQEGVRAWAERGGGLASDMHKRSCAIALAAVERGWNGICCSREGGATSLVHVFGSYVFERRSDVDVVLLFPGTGTSSSQLLHNAEWMDRLHCSLQACIGDGCITGVLVYKAGAIRVPKMAVKFLFAGLPACDLDITILPCESWHTLIGDVTIKQALAATTDNLKCVDDKVAASSVNQRPTALLVPSCLYGVLYGIAVRNTCQQTLSEVGMNARDMGALITAARAVIDGVGAMGTIRRGMRPYLLALALCTVIREAYGEGPGVLSVDTIFRKWLSQTADACKCNAVECLYPLGLVADYHYQRLGAYLKSSSWSRVSSYESSLDSFTTRRATYVALSSFDFPSQWQYSAVHIAIEELNRDFRNESDESELLHSSQHILVGVLHKYISRFVQDGHQVLSTPASYPSKYYTSHLSRRLFLASFSISAGGVDAVKSSFSAISRDFGHGIPREMGKCKLELLITQ